MGWTTSYVWQGRKSSEVSGMIRHEARSVEESQGIQRRHSNVDIDASRTGDNRVLVNDGAGGFKPADSVDEIQDAFDMRIGQRRVEKGRSAPRAIRRGSNTAVLFVLQLDPEFTGPCAGMSAEKRAEVERLHQVMIDEVVERMGQQNVISISHHWDETNPHVHIICTAMTPDDRVAYYQAVGKNGEKCDWGLHHDPMRERLRDNGYDATFERVGKGRKGERLTMFKQQKDQQRAVEDELDREWIRLDGAEGDLASWRGLMDDEFRERAEELDRERKAVTAMREELDESARAVAKAEDQVARDREGVSDKLSQATTALDEAEQMRDAAEREAAQMRQQAEQAAAVAVDEAVGAWERDEMPSLRRKVVKNAEDEADAIMQEAQEGARQVIDGGQQRAQRLLKQAQLEREQLRQEAQEMLDQADAEAQQIRAEARRARDAALEKGWQEGFDQASQAVDEIVDKFRNDLVSDRLKERYQSVSMKIRKRQQSAPHQQVRPGFQLDL